MTLQAIKTSLMKFMKDEDGLTIVEYAVAGGLITAAVAGAFATLGGDILIVINRLIAAVS